MVIVYPRKSGQLPVCCSVSLTCFFKTTVLVLSIKLITLFYIKNIPCVTNLGWSVTKDADPLPVSKSFS